jgi:uncharacterized membrane protein (UPF0127 family)
MLAVHPAVTIASLVSLLMTGASCGRRGGDEGPRGSAPIEEPDTGTAPVRSDPPGPTPTVVFKPIGKPEVRLPVEMARTARQIQRGLMYRKFLPPDGGMLFMFRKTKVQSFWMKNTLIPLDMIFVSADMSVVGVVENAEPQTTKSRTVGKPSLYVIETNAGWTKEHGVVAGVPVAFENIPPIGPADGHYDDDD